MLAPEGYGSYILILTAVSIAQVAAVLGLPQIIIRSVSRKNDALFFIARQALPLLLGGIMAASAGLVGYLFFFTDVNQPGFLIAGATLVTAQGLWAFAEALAFGRQQMHFSSFLNVASSVCWAIVIFGLPENLFSIKVVIAVFSFIQILRASVYLLIEWRSGYFKTKETDRNVSELTRASLVKQSLPLFGTNILSIPVTLLPILFLGRFSGTTEVGFYGIGNRLLAPLALVSGSLMTAVYPILAQSFIDDRGVFITQVQKLFLGLMFVGFLFALTVAVFSKEFVLIVFGPHFAPGITPFAIQAWIACNIMMHSFIGNLFLSANKERTLVSLSVFNGVVIGVASYYGAHFGALGLSFASWGSLVFGFAVHWFVVRRKIASDSFRPRYLETALFAFYVLLGIITPLFADFSLALRAVIFVAGIALLLFLGRSQMGELRAYIRGRVGKSKEMQFASSTIQR